jgi:hypothetical protein
MIRRRSPPRSKSGQKVGIPTPPVVSDQAKGRYYAVLDTLRQVVAAGGQNLECDAFLRYLEELEFIVRKTSRGHYVYSHKGLPGFRGGDFCCEHGRHPNIKRSYIRDFVEILESNEESFETNRSEGKR